MPQVDLESLMSACSGNDNNHKIACETTVHDFPPESFYVSKDAEIDWFDRNALFDRTESAKGHVFNTNPVQNSSSQRYPLSVKPKPSFIGLPKTQKTNFIKNNKKGNKPGNIRLFPKRTGSVNKPVQLAEPSSPNVSCMGRVKSKRKNRKRAEPVKNRSKGICKQFFSMFRTKPVNEPVNEPVDEPVRNKVSESRPVRTGIEPVGLGGMNRFASGRKSSSSADVAEVVG